MEQAIKDAKLLLHKINNGDDAFGKATDDVKRVLTNTYITDKNEIKGVKIMEDKREIVEQFYQFHPQGLDRASTWFDINEYLMDIVKVWDNECIENEYNELCMWLNGEKYLLEWVNKQKGDKNETKNTFIKKTKINSKT